MIAIITNQESDKEYRLRLKLIKIVEQFNFIEDEPKDLIEQILKEVVNMVAGNRRAGKPRTDAERKVRHKKLYGSSKLPKRGTGLKKK